MEIEELRTSWDELGRRDPLWAILTKASARGNRWNRDEFFKTGEYEIKSVLDYVDRMNFKCARERALDFGCGVGRLTQALCEYFRECWGVDIARSMIHLAEQYNQYADRCNYRINESDDLKLFEDNWFDCIYTNLVLQHIHPRFTRKYIGEFLRTLKPAGAAIFAVPSDPIVL